MLNLIKLNHSEWRLLRRLQKKHNVSTEFLRYNFANIQNIIRFETWPRFIIKRFAIRKKNRIFLVHYRLRRVLFDEANRKILRRMKQNVRQWSKRVVAYNKRTKGTEEYVEESLYVETAENSADEARNQPKDNAPDDVSKQLKEQLELLKCARRQQPLIYAANKDRPGKSILDSIANDDLENSGQTPNNGISFDKEDTPPVEEATTRTTQDWQNNLESTPEKQITIQENAQPYKQLASDEKTEKSHYEDDLLACSQNSEKAIKTGLNFLDMLMSKVAGNQTSTAKTDTKISRTSSMNDVYHQHEQSLDSTDEFLGFDDTERLPGMLLTPIVPNSVKNNKNSAFISETLNEYMRENDLETDYNIDEDKSVTHRKITHVDLEGLMTLKTQPPPFDMPAVPDNLLRFRTVAERKSYLQKFSKNSRLAIINNEASIYRELQKRIRFQKYKHSSQQLSQSLNLAMSFTRNGWNAASFVNTEFNKYYFQMLDVDCGKYQVKLRGALGNNDEFRKKPYISKVKKAAKDCRPGCVDDDLWQNFKVIKTISPRSKKLNNTSLPSVFKPCPLSHKALQKPLDDDAAALLLAGGSMAVVRMPTVELEVFPECGRPLNEIAKRYLQHILPHHDISREWAEFSVSTLKLPGSLKDAVKAATDINPRKSFTFLIPYLNDRNHILVRRVVDRSEKLDQSFELGEDCELVPKSDFTFRQNLDSTDEVMSICADVVSDMINTVAISCSENSFIKADPDMLNDDLNNSVKSPNVKAENIPRPPSAASNGEVKKQLKQKRFLLELKRLNATIIDAAIKSEKDKPCSMEYCAMGCVCSSLADLAPVREHCGKTKCILECSCKSSNQSRIMRLETDGRTITTEDAFMLRRKATARLARMEKEFTSTVVLTGNETLLINETNNDKKRRCTKAPKRYEYGEDTEDEERKPLPKKTALTTIDNEKHLAVAIKELREPVYIKDTTLEQLKHCSVSLVRLENMNNIAPWCMVHHLYKCFCKGRALDGKPMVIEKDENNTTIEHGDDEQPLEIEHKINAKARYTFEKVEKKKRKYEDTDEGSDDGNASDNDKGFKVKFDFKTKKDDERIKNVPAKNEKKTKTPRKDSVDISEPRESLLEVAKTETEKRKHSLEDVRERFYASRPECCRRQIPVPRRMFLYCNRKRRPTVLDYIQKHETEKSRLLLNEHIMRSVYYHKKDNEIAKKLEDKISTYASNEKNEEKINSNILENKNEKPTLNTKHKVENETHEIVELLDDDEDIVKSENLTANETMDDSTTQSAPLEQFVANDSNSNSAGVITVKKFATLSSIHVDSPDFTTPISSKSSEPANSMFPKISNCFSLNAKANMCKPSTSMENEQKLQQHLADLTSATSYDSPAFASKSISANNTHLQSNNNDVLMTTGSSLLPPYPENDNVRDIYNNVIRTMNSLVSKKMQDVDFALKRESHIIPTANPDILCIMKWSNFLNAFCQGFAFIWQVKSKDGTYLVATIQNVMPMVFEALGVVNITALKPERLPLMGKMLLNNVRSEHTIRLAIVMQGKQSYWVVKGFLKADPTMACNKPTPETHPSLTKKINVLCTSLVKQRQVDERKKESIHRPMVGQLPQGMASTRNTLPQANTLLRTTLQSSLAQAVQPLQQKPKALQTTAPASSMPSYRKPDLTQALPPNTMPVTASVSSTSTNPAPNPRKRKSVGSNDATTNGIIPSKMESYAKMSTNIEFRKVTTADVDEIHLPETHRRNHKWLVLDLHNDFSHIFVPDFRDLVSLDRIQKVINFAKQKEKIVKLQFFQNAPFDAFVTPKSGKKIYFGPLNINAKPPTLILLQSVDGQMMLRELYQLKHKIQKPAEESTKAFWLLQMNGQTHFEVDNIAGRGIELAASNSTSEGSSYLDDPIDGDDDEDCMIIDEESNELNTQPQTVQPPSPPPPSPPPQPQIQHVQKLPPKERYNFTIASSSNDSLITITPQINSLPGPPPIQTLLHTSNSNAPRNNDSNSLLKLPNTNTIIKPFVSNPPLGSTTTSLLNLPASTVITGLPTVSANVSSSAIQLPQNAIITNITKAPPEASYGSTIFITPTETISKNTGSQTILSKNTKSNFNTSKESLAPANKEIKEANSESFGAQSNQAAMHKRRRISVVCQNSSYDRASQNIAVNAVINKILPDNVQDIQVNNPSGSVKNNVSTIGSTTITKITDSFAEGKTISQNESTFDTQSKKPVVFDVSFVDGCDEPAASIVIKPSKTPSTTVATTTTTTFASTSFATHTTTSATNNAIPRKENPKINLKPTGNMQYKVVKVTTKPQFLNRMPICSTTATANVCSSTVVAPKKLLNTTNQIKITSITSIPAPKSLVNTNSNIRIIPKTVNTSPFETKSSTSSAIRSITITPVISQLKSTDNRVANLANLSPTAAVTLKKVSTIQPTTKSTSQSSSLTTTSSALNFSTPAASTSTITAAATTPTTTSSKNSNSPLAIASVQSFGIPQRTPNINNVDDSSSDIALPPHIQYGYIISSVHRDVKFVAKRVVEEFYVKVPSVGILKLMGLPSVNNYLNKHMLKNSDPLAKTGVWSFQAASKAVQMQNHHKSLLVRKTKQTGTDAKLPVRLPILNTSTSDVNKKVVKISNMSETILIDD